MILLLESLHAEAEALLEEVAPLLRAKDPNEPPDELDEVRAILTRGRGRIEETLMARCPALEVIGRAGAGLDNVDTAAAAKRGIPVIFAPGANASTVAEHTIALMLDLSRGISRWARETAAGRWEERGQYQGDELRGRTLGVIGFGNIGKRVAALADAFGMRVLIAGHSSPTAASQRFESLPMQELLAASDIVTLHLPLLPNTERLLGPAAFARMKPGALLINTARGALIDQSALRQALVTGHLGGFAADVLNVEPPSSDEPLLTADNVLLTPHVASLTATTYRELCCSTARNVARILRGESPEPRSVFARR